MLYIYLFRFSSFIFFSGLLGLFCLLCRVAVVGLDVDEEALAAALGAALFDDTAATTGAACGECGDIRAAGAGPRPADGRVGGTRCGFLPADF